MKKLALLIAAVIGLTGCVAEYDASYPRQYRYGTVEYCDNEGNCRVVENSNYYYGPSGEVYYYDTSYGYWIGPSGYYYGGRWVGGWPSGYRDRYRGYYHGSRGGFHGGRGGGGFRGGHGGHR